MTKTLNSSAKQSEASETQIVTEGNKKKSLGKLDKKTEVFNDSFAYQQISSDDHHSNKTHMAIYIPSSKEIEEKKNIESAHMAPSDKNDLIFTTREKLLKYVASDEISSLETENETNVKKPEAVIEEKENLLTESTEHVTPETESHEDTTNLIEIPTPEIEIEKREIFVESQAVESIKKSIITSDKKTDDFVLSQDLIAKSTNVPCLFCNCSIPTLSPEVESRSDHSSETIADVCCSLNCFQPKIAPNNYKNTNAELDGTIPAITHVSKIAKQIATDSLKQQKSFGNVCQDTKDQVASTPVPLYHPSIIIESPCVPPLKISNCQKQHIDQQAKKHLQSHIARNTISPQYTWFTLCGISTKCLKTGHFDG